jgi:hypothetical protein
MTAIKISNPDAIIFIFFIQFPTALRQDFPPFPLIYMVNNDENESAYVNNSPSAATLAPAEIEN